MAVGKAVAMEVEVPEQGQQQAKNAAVEGTALTHR
jgi:hypothetical protein